MPSLSLVDSFSIHNLGRSFMKDPCRAQQLIWLHAVSMGSNASSTIAQQHPDFFFSPPSWLSMTMTSLLCPPPYRRGVDWLPFCLLWVMCCCVIVKVPAATPAVPVYVVTSGAGEAFCAAHLLMSVFAWSSGVCCCLTNRSRTLAAHAARLYLLK